MKFTIQKDKLQNIIDGVLPVSEELAVKFGKSGIVTSGKNKSGVSMVLVKVDSALFEDYEGDNNKRGINIVRLEDIISMADSESLITVEDRDGGDKLNVSFEGISYTTQLISLKNVREGSNKMPDIDWQAELEMSNDKLKQSRDACKMVGDHMEFIINDNVLTIEANGDMDDVDIEPKIVEEGLDEDDEEGEDKEGDVLYPNELPDNCSAMYSMQNIDDIIDNLDKNSWTNIRFADDGPIAIEFELESGDGKLSYAIAPRIQN